MPSLPRIFALLSAGSEDVSLGFPLHGAIALEREPDDRLWKEVWRLP
jgi:hypothetical protein